MEYEMISLIQIFTHNPFSHYDNAIKNLPGDVRTYFFEAQHSTGAKLQQDIHTFVKRLFEFNAFRTIGYLHQFISTDEFFHDHIIIGTISPLYVTHFVSIRFQWHDNIWQYTLGYIHRDNIDSMVKKIGLRCEY